MRHSKALTAAAAAGLLVTVLSSCSDDDGGSSSSSSPSVSVSVGNSPTASASAQSPSPSGSTSPGSGTVSSTSNALGTILVDGQSRTVYLFAMDTSTASTCSGSCAQAWPPVMASGNPTAGSGVKSNLLGTTTRSDGKKQVTYNGHPLYTFTGDTGSGQTNGQGLNAFGARWYVVGTNGNRITTPAQSPGSGY